MEAYLTDTLICKVDIATKMMVIHYGIQLAIKITRVNLLMQSQKEVIQSADSVCIKTKLNLRTNATSFTVVHDNV